MYALLLAVIYIAFVSLGLPDSLVGSGWPVMHGDLGVPIAFAGIITMVIAAGTIVSSLLSERLTRRFGAPLVTAVSVSMTAAAVVGFSVSGSFWQICLWAIPYGLGAGAVDAALNNYVALHYAARHMNWLHSFWGVGASISPFIMSYAITSGLGWPAAFRTVGVIQVVLSVVLFASLPLWESVHRKVPAGPDAADDPAEAGSRRAHVPLREALRIPGVVLVLVAFFSYCALESTSLIWAATYLVSDRGVTPGTAAAFGSLYILGITAGRFLAGFFADRVGDRALIRGGFLAIGLGAVMIALPLPTDAVGLAGLVVAGLGSAPVYPAIIHATPGNFGRRNSQAVIGIQMAAAYLGSTLAPPLFGAMSAWLGMWLFPFYVAVFAVVGLIMSERLNGLVDHHAALEPGAPDSDRRDPPTLDEGVAQRPGRAVGGKSAVREERLTGDVGPCPGAHRECPVLAGQVDVGGDQPRGKSDGANPPQGPKNC